MSETVNVEKEDDTGFDESLGNLSEAYDIGLEIRGKDVVVITKDDDEIIGDVFEIAEDARSLRQIIEDKLGSVSNLGRIDRLQESLFENQWTGEGFRLDYRKTDNGVYQLIVPFESGSIIVDEFKDDADIARARKLVNNTEIPVERFYEVFCNHDFIISEINDSYWIRRFDESYTEEISESYTSVEYKPFKTERRRTEYGHSGEFVDDKSADRLTWLTVITGSVGTSVASVVSANSSASVFTGELPVTLFSLTVGVVAFLISGFILTMLGVYIGKIISAVLAVIRRRNHKMKSSNYRPLYKVRL